ncbi:MAG: toll/interleukin-1 receptor domain-containing protein [Saprospiraceae bacterium]|nr:toll/interleukin-1 receptor domain-containing protein [Saprospiraceae bacterium]
MTNDQWNILRYALDKNKCLLLLGAGASTLKLNNQTRPVTEWLALELAKTLRKDYPDIILLPGEENSLLYIATVFEERKERGPLVEAIEQFFNKHQIIPNGLHEVAARLPFSLIISTSPDDALDAAYGTNKFPVWEHYTRFRNNEKENRNVYLNEPTVESPLVYRLFGSAADSDSLILTEKDRILFVEDIVQHNNAIPNTILSRVADDTALIFIGFDFEQWHLRLLLRALFAKKDLKAKVFVPYGGNRLSPGTEVFFQKQFNASFLPDQPLDFLKEMETRWNKYESGRKQLSAPGARLEVLYLYDLADRPYQQEIVKYLTPLCEKFGFRSTDIHDMPAGSHLVQESVNMINRASLVVFLASPDALANKELYEKQLSLVMERRVTGEVALFPVHLHNCSWQLTVFANQLVPLDADKSPVSSWKNRADAYQILSRHFERHLKIITKQRNPIPATA